MQDMDIGTEGWIYLAEGGANLVLSRPEQDDTVLRVTKRPRSNTHSTSESSQTQTETQTNAVIFAERVLSCLLPPTDIASLRPFAVHHDFLQKIAVYYDNLDPRIARCQTDQVDVIRHQVILAENMVPLSGWAIEIKPKWGFLPQRVKNATKQHYCRTCMHRVYKARHGLDVFKLSEEWCQRYCPLDLFSGEPERVKKALEALIKDWKTSNGKTNNFRFFRNGKRCDPSMVPDSVAKEWVQPVQQALADSNILSRLRALQVDLDPIDIDGLASRIRAETSAKVWPMDHNRGDTTELFSEPSMESFSSVAERLRDHGNVLGLPLRDQLVALLLSATFKDCSLFVSVFDHHGRRANDTNNVDDAIDSYQREIKVRLVDLEPKPMSKLSHYYQLDRDIVTYFEESGLTTLPPCQPN